MSRFSAVVLAGGAGRRMGGAEKPVRLVHGVPMVNRVLDAVAAARPRIVVGALELVALLPKGVSLTRERPPGGGPVAAVAAGLALLERSPTPLVAVLASDLPLLTASTVDSLRAAVEPDVDGALLVDDADNPQWLAGVWRTAALRAAIPDRPAGLALRTVLGGLRYARVRSATGRPPAWFDCDTETDLAQAEEWPDAG